MSAVQALVNVGNCLVNAATRSGSRALHFAASNGHAYVVELLLSHAQLDMDALDGEGKRAVQLAGANPRDEWRAVAQLLTAARASRLPKVQVDLMDGSNAMLSLLSGADTTADQLRDQMLDQLSLPLTCARLFAIWICSHSLGLLIDAQLKPVYCMLCICRAAAQGRSQTSGAYAALVFQSAQ